MKYKVGDKVLLQGKVFKIEDDNIPYPYGIRIAKNVEFMFGEEEMISKTYEDGLDDAWELARKVSHMCLNDMNICFGLEELDKFGGDKALYEHFTPQEALAKLEAYEKSQQIEVGDVVETGGNLAVVVSFGTSKVKDDSIHVVYFDGVTNCLRKDNKSIKKTGRHIDISSLLEQIRGNE